jgi:Zn-dependent protease with chaperone function
VNHSGYAGILFGPEDESGTSCTVVPRGGGLEILVGGQSRVLLDYASMKIAVTGLDDKYLSFAEPAGDGQRRVLVPDKEIATQIEALGAPRSIVDQLGRASSTRTRRKAGRWTVLVAAAAVLIALALAAWAGFLWALEKIVDEIPPEWEVELGRAVATDLLAEQQVCSDPTLNNAVQELGRRLVVGVGVSPYRWRIRVLDSDEVNAFALPGGYVFVNRGLIEKAGGAHEVGGVVAHEVSHVIERHGLENAVREIGLMLVLYSVVGDSGAIEQFLAANAAGMASMSFSRDQEREADRGGARIMYAAGLDPAGLIRFTQTLATEEGAVRESLTILSTHPASAERAEELAELIAEWGPPQITPLESDWSAIKGLCSPVTVTDPDQP